MIERIIPFAHRKLSEVITKDDYVIDATCGNGHDTLFLSSISKHVYAFDIQKDAILNSQQLLSSNKIENVTFINDSHTEFDAYDLKKVKGIMYNLGYLPGTNNGITTSYKSTLISVSKGLNLLLPKGIMVITVYIGHTEGAIESEKILEFVSNLQSRDYNVLRYEMINKNNSPYNILIEKLR